MSFRTRIHEALERPANGAERAVSFALLALIVMSVVALVARMQYPDFAAEHSRWFEAFEMFALAVFSLEYVVRAVVAPRPVRYLAGFGGLVDLAAILPGLLTLFGIAVPTTAWLRALRVLRFLRVLKLGSAQRRSRRLFSGTVLQRVMPFMAAGFVVKLAVIALELRGWWFDASELTQVVAVIGFAIGILLAQKLGVAQERMYAIEDAINTIIGSLRLVRYTSPYRGAAKDFAASFQRLLVTGKGRDEVLMALDEMMNALRDDENSWFAEAMAQNAQFVIHRIETRTPEAYDTFLRRVSIAYGIIIMAFIPGVMGLIAMLLFAYVLGGMYLLVDDMDRPINFTGPSLMDADIGPLRELNDLWSEVLHTVPPPSKAEEAPPRERLVVTIPPEASEAEAESAVRRRLERMNADE